MKPRRIILFRFFVLLFVIPAADAAVPDAARQPWDETVKAAEKEGAVSVYFWQGGNLDKAIGIFQKKFPALRLHAVGGRGSAFMNRIVTEMRAGKHLADVCFCGVTSPYELLHKQAAALDSIKNAFVLREVTEPSTSGGKASFTFRTPRVRSFSFTGGARRTRAFITTPRSRTRRNFRRTRISSIRNGKAGSSRSSRRNRPAAGARFTTSPALGRNF